MRTALQVGPLTRVGRFWLYAPKRMTYLKRKRHFTHETAEYLIRLGEAERIGNLLFRKVVTVFVAFIMWSSVMSVQSVQAGAIPQAFTLSQDNLDPRHSVVAGWPLSRQMALLKLRNSEVSRAVMEKLAHATTRAGLEDYEFLVRNGFAYRTPIKGRMRILLFPTAFFDTDRLARAWAKELGLHILMSRSRQRRDEHSIASDVCTCGEVFSYRKGWNTLRSNGSGFGAHIDAVRNGTWKRFDHDAFMAKIEARMAADADARAAERRRTG